jgi:TolB protein
MLAICVRLFPPLLLLMTTLVGGFSMGLRSTTPQLTFQSDRSGNWEIYLLDLNTRLLHNLTRHPADDMYPAWSHTTGQLAFYSAREWSGTRGIYIADSNGQNAHPIKVGGAYYWRPSWSADGQQLVFMMGYNEIRIINADGTGEKSLTFGFSPVWSPVQSEVLYYSDRPGDLTPNLYLVNADGTNVRHLTRNAEAEWDGVWSPDGTRMAFVSSKTGNSEIYLRDTVSGTTRRLTLHPGEDMSPAWSPDGRRIAFVSRRTGTLQVYVIHEDGTGEMQVTGGTGASMQPAWKP